MTTTTTWTRESRPGETWVDAPMIDLECKPFGMRPRGVYGVYVDKSGTVRIYDDVMRGWTSCHDITPEEQAAARDAWNATYSQGYVLAPDHDENGRMFRLSPAGGVEEYRRDAWRPYDRAFDDMYTGKDFAAIARAAWAEKYGVAA